MMMISDSFVGSCKQEPHPSRARRAVWFGATRGEVRAKSRGCGKYSEGKTQGTHHFVEKPRVKQRYAYVLAATAPPFAREIVNSINPDHRLCGRVSVSLSSKGSGTRDD